MGFAITENTLHSARERTREFFQHQAPKIAAKVLKPRVVARTKSGKDSDGVNMVAYSKSYAKYGRAAYGLPTSPVDLYGRALDGQHMLESMDYYSDIQTQEGQGHALAVSAETNARATGNQSKRHFMGVNPTDGPAVVNAIAEAYNAL